MSKWVDLIRHTRVYQEAFAEGERIGKLEAVPYLLGLGLTVEELAEELGLDVEEVRQAAKQQRSK